MNNVSIRTRFSPSPTGMIHLGNARAALFSALYAAKYQGVFILRIEDTDALRSEHKYVESLQEDMLWLGIDWQEGPGKDAEFGPYWQSKRQDIYAKYYDILEEKKLIYPCFCTDQELNLARKMQLSRGHAPRYLGTCRKLSVEEIQQRIAAGAKPAWRFSVPLHQTIEFVDTVKGLQQFKSDDIGDFIVRRADTTSPFLFCNAIDDAMMKVSHVLRGEDHLTNTPRQIMLLQTLNLHIPQYGHLALIVGDDGAPLSKRHGSFSVDGLRKDGYLAVAIINYLGRLGHGCDVQTLLPFNELAAHFDLDKLSRSPARFDVSQLLFWQKIAVQALDAAAFWEWVGDEIKMKVPADKRDIFAEKIKANVEFPQDAKMWAEILFNDEVIMDDERVIDEAGAEFFRVAAQAVDKHGINFVDVLNDMKSQLSVNGKKLFMPLRMALTGKIHGPELALIAEFLGKEKIKQRIEYALVKHRVTE